MSQSNADESDNRGGSGELIGKVIFTLTIIAMLTFFWWLLLYDHGVSPSQ